MRTKVTIDQRHHGGVLEPGGEARHLVLRPPGRAPLDSLVVIRDSPRLVVYFPGFNTPLGPWEALKCRMLAESFDASVVVTEIPGMSRFGDPIPLPVRRDMVRGRIDPWAELAASYVDEAIRVCGIGPFAEVHLIGYSTGCSLGTAAVSMLPGPVSRIILIEPVAMVTRNWAELEAHNVADWLRQPRSYRTNRPIEWAMAAHKRQRREPFVKYGVADLMAIAQVLGQAELASTELPAGIRVDLARGERSSLCRVDALDALHSSLERSGHPGLTAQVAGHGHPMWHSFPVIVPLLGAISEVDPAEVLDQATLRQAALS